MPVIDKPKDEASVETLTELPTDPVVQVDTGQVYSKDIAGISELHYLDSNGNAVQITAAGAVSAASGVNTLDLAYDQGGAGAGRTIIADAGAVFISGTDGLQITGGSILAPTGSFTDTVSSNNFIAAGSIIAGAGSFAGLVNIGDFTNAAHNHSNAAGGGTVAIADTTGTLGETRGGTNQTTYTTGDVLFSSASNTLSKLAVGGTGSVLTVSAGLPAWLSPAETANHLDNFDANTATFPATNPAAATSRNEHPLLAFDDTTSENVVFHSLMSNDYSNGALTIDIDWVASSATAGSVTWGAEIERIAADGHDIDANSFAAQQTIASTTNVTAGIATRASIAFTQAQADAITAGDSYRLRIENVAANGNLVGDAQLLRVGVRQ